MTVLFYGPFSPTAAANPGIVIGFAVDSEGLVVSSQRGEQVRLYLEKQLSLPVKMRSFSSQDHLYSWLSRFSEVDLAWFSQDFLNRIPAGQVYSLVRIDGHSAGRQGEIVAGQWVDAEIRQQARQAFLAMHEQPAGRELLAQLGISRFVASPLWQTPGWDRVARPSKASSASTATAAVRKGPEEVVTPTVTSPVQVAAPAAESPLGAEPVAAALSVPERQPQSPLAAVSEAPPVSPASTPTEPEPTPALQESAPDRPAPAEQVALVADRLAYNAEEDTYEAQGDVILRRAGVELRSEQLLWQAATQDADARGAVQLSDAGGRASGESMQYNVSTGQGQIRDGEVFISQGNFHLAGAEIEKQGQADYYVKNGSFTTCDGDIPDWKFTADEVDVTLGGYARAKHVFFHIKDVPVFYTPYLLFPVKTERESGFLMPMFGYSNHKGFIASLAWYQVIDRNMDATVYVDYLSDLALGTGLEYRYALANQNDGRAFIITSPALTIPPLTITTPITPTRKNTSPTPITWSGNTVATCLAAGVWPLTSSIRKTRSFSKNLAALLKIITATKLFPP